VSFASLLGTEILASSDAALERWRENNSVSDRTPGAALKPKRAGNLRAIVGQGSLDAMHLDLRTQGPHALVGGTTGSGKSEFLQAWVLGMAAEYSPDRVTFLFVDYKGGSAFADCVKLPHCVGLVTDLSPRLVRRALTSLRAELHYREHLLNRKKAKDLIELEKRGDPEAPPALVLVIDEFAALAGDVPDFVDGVVDVAQRGRSLGIHLIMATQRPAGVIRDNLRANTNLRIALRMADESDSMDVVGDKIAGTFDPTIPGRAIAKTGPGRLTGFQSAYAGGWTSEEIIAPSRSPTCALVPSSRGKTRRPLQTPPARANRARPTSRASCTA
jgi:S-DNA-T family DNA segregation ATPase FtsK/SpoIIIE